MTNTQDINLLEETLSFMLSKARDQDIVVFFAAFSRNYKARRMLTTFVKNNYDKVSVSAACAYIIYRHAPLLQLVERFNGSMTFGLLIPVSRCVVMTSSQEEVSTLSS